MRRKILFGAAFVLATCAFAQVTRAAPETYDFSGYVAGSKILDPTVRLPTFLAGCNCPELIGAPIFIGTLVVDLALPPDQRLIELSVFAYTGERLEVLAGHPDNRVRSQTTSQLGIGVPPPHWEIVTAVGKSAPLPAQAGRSITMSLQWHGKPGAPRQYPAVAQDVDLGTLTPQTSWRINFTLSDDSAVYATALANVVALQRRGTGGLDFEETFADGAAQGWTPQGGAWSAATGDLRNAANTAFTSNTIDGISLPDQFVMVADVYLSWGASGNTAGVVFNYHGPGDFFEVRLNAQGSAWFSNVIGGVRHTAGPVPYPDAGVGRWHTIYVKRSGQRGVALQIEINGKQLFETEFDIFEPDPTIGGTAGVFASWNRARFDNVMVGAPIAGLGWGLARFNSEGDNPPSFTQHIGTWTIANGYMRSSTNQAASIATTQTAMSSDVYGISGLIYLEWSGPGNWGGLVYDYIDAQNYREVRVSRSVVGRTGEIVLAERVNGVRRELFRAPRFQSSTDREVLLTIRREHDVTIVHDSGVFSNVQIRQARRSVRGRAGLLAAWNLVRFDNVIVDSVQEQ